MAFTGDSCHAFANSSALTPATFAKVSSGSLASFHDFSAFFAVVPFFSAKSSNDMLPFSTALCMFCVSFERDVPPASALIPTEERAADIPRISGADSPARVPAEANLCAISMISASVVAVWLPRSIITEAMFLMLLESNPVTF